MKWLLVICASACLFGCGVDGDPIRPDPAQDRASGSIGVTVTGSAAVGVRGGSSR